jgi:hypothetical protein
MLGWEYASEREGIREEEADGMDRGMRVGERRNGLEGVRGVKGSVMMKGYGSGRCVRRRRSTFV